VTFASEIIVPVAEIFRIDFLGDIVPLFLLVLNFSRVSLEYGTRDNLFRPPESFFF